MQRKSFRAPFALQGIGWYTLNYGYVVFLGKDCAKLLLDLVFHGLAIYFVVDPPAREEEDGKCGHWETLNHYHNQVAQELNLICAHHYLYAYNDACYGVKNHKCPARPKAQFSKVCKHLLDDILDLK